MKIGKIILSFLLFTSVYLQAQPLALSLEKTISLAADSSLEAFRTKNMYLAGYWQYRTYKADRLPSLTLNLTPAQYYRDITRRYNSQKDADEYKKQESFYANGNMEIKQNFDLLGGTFYLDSELGFMRNFGDDANNQFTTVPIRLGYQQSLFGYNPFRWERKIEPLKYEKVKKELLYNIEQISEQATTYFFALAMAQAEYDLAKENVASTDTLYRTGQERHKIASINKAELLTLKLDAVNARNTLQNTEIALKRAMFSLASFLNFDKNTEIRLTLPGRPRDMQISVDEALALARENNPKFLGLRQEIMEAEQQVDKTKKEAMFNASINASIGFNQVSSKLKNAYRDPLQQDIVSVSVSIPLVDWGGTERETQYRQKQSERNTDLRPTGRTDRRGRCYHDGRRFQYPTEPDQQCGRSTRPGSHGLQRNQAAIYDRKGGYQQPDPLPEPPAGGTAQLYLRPAKLLVELFQDTKTDVARL